MGFKTQFESPRPVRALWPCQTFQSLTPPKERQAPKHQNATFTPTLMLRPISGAADLMNEVCA